MVKPKLKSKFFVSLLKRGLKIKVPSYSVSALISIVSDGKYLVPFISISTSPRSAGLSAYHETI